MNLFWAAKMASDTSCVPSSCLALSSLSSCIALLVYLVSSGTSGAGIPVEVRVLDVFYQTSFYHVPDKDSRSWQALNSPENSPSVLCHVQSTALGLVMLGVFFLHCFPGLVLLTTDWFPTSSNVCMKLDDLMCAAFKCRG